MSTLYNLEPQPTAKVLLSTTSGDILLELFAKQAPLASRNFLQHCLDGYYDNTIFHRLVPGFIVQGGDPTGTGHGGESIFPGGEAFEDEFHNRLKYNRRGLLGMANGGGKNDNGSQFFMTLAETPELQGRNTLFGRIMGDTIFNLMKMADAEMEAVEGSERPLYPTKITGTEILVNPFEDMTKREVKVRQVRGSETSKQEKGGKTKGKNKGGKALLSFANGEEEVEEVLMPKREKFNPKLVSAGADVTTISKDAAAKTSNTLKTGEKKTIRKPVTRSLSPPSISQPNPQLQLPLPSDEVPSRSPSTTPEPAAVKKMNSLLQTTNAQIADLKASMKRDVTGKPATETNKKSALEQMIPEHAMRGRKRKMGSKEGVEQETMAMLNAFRTKLEKATPESKEVSSSKSEDAPPSNIKKNPPPESTSKEDNNNNDEAELCDLHFIANCQSCQDWERDMLTDTNPTSTTTTTTTEANDTSWMSHALTFEKDRLGKDLTWKRKNEEELVVIDPREKAKDIREEQRAKKMARIGGRAGIVGSTASTGTEWSRDRDRGREPVKAVDGRRGGG